MGGETNPVSPMQGSTSNPISPMADGAGVGIDNQSINLDDEENIQNEDQSVRGENTQTDDGVGNTDGAGEDVDKVELKRKRQKTSVVWEEFVIVTLPDGKEKAECIHCKVRLAKAGTGTTTTYKRHLESCAKRRQYKRTQQLLNFPPSSSDGDKPLPLVGPDTKYDANKMRESIANWIMGTEQPFTVVENDLFLCMMKRANPLFSRISRATAKEDCFKVYEHEKKKLKALTNAASTISLTTDCWKSSHQKSEYMVITGHFIDQKWRLQKRVLSFVHVPPPRTGLDIADGIYKCLKEWGIEGKIFSISVDNASYNDRAVNTLKNNFSKVKKLPCGGRLFHVRCCVHILNLLVKDGLSTIYYVIAEVREAVKYINHSEARLQSFSKVALQLQVRDRKLLLDVPTRWNSTYDMLCVAMKFKDVFPRYAEYEPHFHHLPSEEDWKNVEKVCQILKVFKVCTSIISGSEYPTANLYLIEVYKVEEVLDRASQSEDDFIHHMVIKMKEKFDKYWGECHLLMAIASVLDPRFKMKLVEFSYPKLYTTIEATKNIEDVAKALEDMYSYYLEMHHSSTREASTYSSVSSGGSNASSEGASLRSGWEAFGQFIESVDLEGPEKSELAMYLEEGVHKVQGQGDMHSFDALEWWNVHKLKYRILSKMAMDVLAIPISTVASESTFSAGGRVIDPYRSLLAPQTVQMLICGGDWIRQTYGVKKNVKKEDMPIEVVLPTMKTS